VIYKFSIWKSKGKTNAPKGIRGKFVAVVVRLAMVNVFP
jgi:hypothetical protein